MSAREMIEAELDKSYTGQYTVTTSEDYSLAAERVIERLQQRVEELEQKITAHEKAAQEFRHIYVEPDRERYRDRLDRMVASKSIVGMSDITNAVSWSIKALTAIDAEVEKENAPSGIRSGRP